MRLLILDAYPREGREALRAAGGTEAGLLYQRLLGRLAPGAHTRIAHPADADPFPTCGALTDYDGLVWTGSSLSIHVAGDARVQRQVELARAAFREGVPCFGSCWAAQLAAVAAGGHCAPSPKGREFGVSREIALTTAGRGHPLFAGKPQRFDAWTSHADEVTALPPGAELLATNAFTRVQALCVTHGRGTFWAVQYHPEYDPHEVAALARLRRGELVVQGRFASDADAARFEEALETLQRDPARSDVAHACGVGPALLDPEQRALEARNWLTHQVRDGARHLASATPAPGIRSA